MVKKGLIFTAGTSFHSISLILYLFYSIIATKCECQFSKGCAQQIQSYIKIGGKWADIYCSYEFSLNSFDSFFILLYNSYKICLKSFERLHLAVPKLNQNWWEMGWSGTSFHSIFLILFLFSSTHFSEYFDVSYTVLGLFIIRVNGMFFYLDRFPTVRCLWTSRGWLHKNIYVIH